LGRTHSYTSQQCPGSFVPLRRSSRVEPKRQTGCLQRAGAHSHGLPGTLGSLGTESGGHGASSLARSSPQSVDVPLHFAPGSGKQFATVSWKVFRTQRFITVFTTARQWALLRIKSSHHISRRFTPIYSSYGSDQIRKCPMRTTSIAHHIFIQSIAP
jgi:hypothetical protein